MQNSRMSIFKGVENCPLFKVYRFVAENPDFESL